MQRLAPAQCPSTRAAAIAATILLGVIPCGGGRADAGDPAAHLGAAIPSDVHFYSRWQRSEAQEPLFAAFRSACRRLAASGILKDLRGLLAEAEVDPQGLEELRKLSESLSTVPWRELFSSEVAVAMRLRLPIPEWVFLARLPAGRASAHVDALRPLFQRLAEVSGHALVTRDITVGDHPGISLGVQDVPFAIEVVHRGDVLACGFSRPLLAASLRLADAKPFEDERAIVDSDRYRRALDGMRERRDSESIVDIAGCIATFHGIVQGLAAAAGGSDEEAAAVLDLGSRILGEAARFGTVASVAWSEPGPAGPHGLETTRIHEESRVLLGEGHKDSSFFRSFVGREPLGDVLRIVPEGATSFGFTRGIDVAVLHARLERTLRERLPGGEHLLDRWAAVQDGLGFHLREDLLAWLDGGGGWVAFPGEHGGTEWGAFVKVSDPELARRKLRAGLERVASFLASRGQSLEAQPGDGLPEELRVLHVGAFPRCRPVAGVAGDHLAVMSSPAAARAIAATFEGKRARFTGKEGFRLEDVLADVAGRPAYAVAYADLEGRLEGLAQLLSAAGFAASIVPMERDTVPLIRLGAVLTKLGAFVRDIDLGLQTVSWTGIDGDRGVITTRRATSIRTPRADAASAQPPGSEEKAPATNAREL